MAKKNSELEEAYDVLDKLSADEKKRLEYETRQRAIRDYNIGMLTAERRGIEAGRKIGRQEGREEGRQENTFPRLYIYRKHVWCGGLLHQMPYM